MSRSGLVGLMVPTALVICASPALAQEPAAAPPPFRIEALVDFVDDALAAVITPAHVEAMMTALHEMGVSRVSWAYYGDGHGGFMFPKGLNEEWRRCAETYRVLGNPLRVAAEAAHRHGIELYAYYKPYETGPGISFPDGSPEAREFGRLPQQGGWLTWMDPFVLAHPQFRLRHRPDASIGDLSGVPICGLRLVKRDNSPTRVTREHLQIWTGQLNHGYQPLKPDFTVQEASVPSPKDVRDLNGTLVTRQGDPVRTLTLSGFRLTDPYVLVTTDFTDGPADFANTGTDLLVALDEQGREIPGVFATGNGVWEAQRVDFRTWGLLFDMGFGRSVLQLDVPNASGRQGIIAFTRGRNEYLPGALCETEPQVRAFWLACIQEMLDAGVDGVDFRVENHGTHTDYYDEYGFNDVVLQECARRGLAGDAAAVAQVRGEAYTEFLRQAKRLIGAAGKRMRINLNLDWFRPDPPPARRLAYPANLRLDWQAWVDEGLLDEGILRLFALPFDTVFNDSIAAAMISRCQAKGLPLTVNRYINPAYPAEFARVLQDGRFSGFILYETASYLRLQDPAGCQLNNAVVDEVCRKFREGRPTAAPQPAATGGAHAP
jgi:hypothetical protein